MGNAVQKIRNLQVDAITIFSRYIFIYSIRVLFFPGFTLSVNILTEIHFISGCSICVTPLANDFFVNISAAFIAVIAISIVAGTTVIGAVKASIEIMK